MTIRVGDKAPGFHGSLVTGSGPFEAFSFADIVGTAPIVLEFFPLAFSGVCTPHNCAIRDTMPEFERHGALVVSVSVDPPHALRAFAKMHRLSQTFVSDFNREAMRAWDVIYDEFLGLRGVSKRAAFVVDRGGVVRYTWVTDDADVAPDQAAIERALARVA